jgi:caffeoyl-CoA O-methyltransferase
MICKLFTLSVFLVASCVALCQQPASSELRPSVPANGTAGSERKILGVLDGMVKSHQTYLSVPMQDGKALRLLTEAAGAKNVVEIGTSTGYSGLWFCLALQKMGGHLTTFEIDHERASQARDHFKEAGVEQMVTIIEGDAHEQVTRLKAPVDLVFIDADKGGYLDYLKKLRPLVRPGGLILAHNVDMVPDYLKAVTTSEEFETILYMEGGGLSVTLKKR